VIDAMKDMCDGLDWLREHTTPAMIQLTIAKDRAIAEALAAIQPLWTSEEVGRRCVLLRTVGSALETLHVDGIPVIVFYPGEATQEWKDDKLVVTYTQKYRRVRAVEAGNS